MSTECGSSTGPATVIGASAILAYLFLPWRNGTKPQFAAILAHFAIALTAVLGCVLAFDALKRR